MKTRVLLITLTVAAYSLLVAPSAVKSAPGIPFYDVIANMTKSGLDLVASSVPSFTTLGWSTYNKTLGKVHELAVEHSDPDKFRNVSEIIQARLFECQEYDVVTRDGYILTIQRIINPLVKADYRPKMKPVILQHGLMSSSADWVINSLNVKPDVFPRPAQPNKREDIRPTEKLKERDNLEDQEENELESEVEDDDDDDDERPSNDDSRPWDTQEHPNGLGFYLANRGYDVFLSNSRGNIYGQRHVKMSKYDAKFWSFTFDEQIKYDLPDVISFVQKLTNHTKVGYVGHSQGTLMGFGLLSDQPDYADIIEPFVALAPVAYVSNTVTPAKFFSVWTPVLQGVNMCFATPNWVISYLGPIVCGPDWMKKEICANAMFLGTGFDWDQLDETRFDAYLGHQPAGTSVKNIAHYGQMVLSGRFAKFDHGILANKIKYDMTRAPDYKLGNIRSKSIALFVADNDWLAVPKDVAKLRRDLKVKPYAVFNITEEKPNWNHIDFVYGKDAGILINTKIEKVFEAFRDT